MEKSPENKANAKKQQKWEAAFKLVYKSSSITYKKAMPSHAHLSRV